MKAIETDAIITSIRAKRDGSLGLGVDTPGLKTKEKAEFMELQGINLKLLINPLDTIPEGLLRIKTEVNQKSQKHIAYGLFYSSCGNRKAQKARLKPFIRKRQRSISNI